jgi:hypothetical protein
MTAEWRLGVTGSTAVEQRGAVGERQRDGAQAGWRAGGRGGERSEEDGGGWFGRGEKKQIRRRARWFLKALFSAAVS